MCKKTTSKFVKKVEQAAKNWKGKAEKQKEKLKMGKFIFELIFVCIGASYR